MISRYMRSPYDPDNSRNLWGYVISRTLANPPRSGPGRWFAWMLALTFLGIAATTAVFGAIDDTVLLLWTIVFGTASVVVLVRLLRRA